MGDFWSVPDVLAYLAGSWDVDRTVRDLASGAEGTFIGTTVFGPLESSGRTEESEALLHYESGTFVWQGTPRPAERTLRFLRGQPPGTAIVQFSDGRPFHDLDLRSGRHMADHPCSADLYRGEFTVHSAERWRTRWQVAGPVKDLLLATEYRRR
ncbi:hypothetical protein H1V43_14135 [Streptomyces sp. PSKA54]|uniref:DUF6314 domain-containing protein n=1 Tax=Streptomyces himalayensis subsp. aureolus TaxID=2758039 RepID=A0A7W2HG04_9ACTN|nr:hypothetical protein [Streptomyces himalayensis subsp. aureolus]